MYLSPLNTAHRTDVHKKTSLNKPFPHIYYNTSHKEDISPVYSYKLHTLYEYNPSSSKVFY
jgi:hypothetical protein